MKSDEWFQNLVSILIRLIEWTQFKWNPNKGKSQNDYDEEPIVHYSEKSNGLRNWERGVGEFARLLSHQNVCTLICFYICLGHLELHYPHWAIDERVIDGSGMRGILVKSTFVRFKGLALSTFESVYSMLTLTRLAMRFGRQGRRRGRCPRPSRC